MTIKPLPTKLNKEPLVDIVCGVNFSSDAPAESLLPGLLLSKLPPENRKIETLAAAQLPQIVRNQNPNLQSAPLMKMTIDEKHFVLIGSQWLSIGCTIPYSGWAIYKEKIKLVLSVLNEAEFIQEIKRCSLKYVDFIKYDEPSSFSKTFNLSVTIAGRPLESEQVQLRVEVSDPKFLHAVTVVSKANFDKPGEAAAEGALLSVDTHRVECMSTSEFKDCLDVLLDEMHLANKQFFFNLLSDDGLKKLEPVYGS